LKGGGKRDRERQIEEDARGKKETDEKEEGGRESSKREKIEEENCSTRAGYCAH
jgi:hypothetical protein